jgi:hypothetical protein
MIHQYFTFFDTLFYRCLQEAGADTGIDPGPAETHTFATRPQGCPQQDLTLIEIYYILVYSILLITSHNIFGSHS